MKILKVKFANINSLGGEWEIDFEHQDFQNSSMFCIAGPTGSGKTSILDAICLGLYGRTPRQQPTGSSNEVMTNGESSCYAAVTLDVNGTRYTATWKQTRARTGTLKGYEWKLVNETTGDATTSSKSREIESTIAECIGLNYDEFTKSVMLAQGKFNEFLVSKEKDRAAVLEKLTGDSSCRKLAQAVYELYDNSQKELQRLRDQMGGITLLTEEELEQLAKDLGQAASAKESLGVQVENLQKIVDWYKTLHSCEEKLQIANNTFKNAQDAKIAFAPFEAKLSRAQDAHEVEATYEAYRQVLQGIEKNKERKKKLIYNLEEARKEKENACKASDTATAKAEEAAKAYSQNEPLWSEIENLDTRISAVKSNVSATESTCATAERKLQEQLNRLEALSLKIKNNETVLDGCEKFAAQHQADETIGESLSLLQTKAAEFKASRETVANAQKDVAGAELALEKFKEKRKGDGEKLESVNQYLARHDADKNLKELLPGLKNQFQTFAVSIDDEAKCHKSITSEVVCAEKLQNTVDGFTKSIADLKAEKEKIVQDDIPVIVAELRERLSEGCACPVCGSKDHPACNGTVEKSTENGAAALNDFAQKLKHLDGLIGNAEISKAQSETQLQTCNKNLEDLKSELVVLQEKRAGLLKELNLAVAPWGKSVSIESLAQIEKDLAAAKDIYEGKLIEKADYEKRVSESAVLEAQLQAALDGKIQNRSKALELQGELSRNLEKAFSPWFGNYRDEDVDAFLNQLQTRKKNWDENDSRKKKCESELGVDRSARQELSKNIETSRQDLETATSQWKEAVEQRDILLKERHEKFGEKIVASERNQAAQTRDQLKDIAKKADASKLAAQNAFTSLETQVQECDSSIHSDTERLNPLKDAYQQKLSAKNFTCEENFLASRLPEGERNSLSTQQKKVDDGLLAAKTAQEGARRDYDQHKSTCNFQMEEANALQTLDESKKSLQEKVDAIAALNAKKNQDDVNRRQCFAIQSAIDAKTPRATPWAQMHDWFGQKNGDDFVEFVQQISMRNLLKLANRHLSIMYPRYEMICNGLDIQLVDHDNSNSVRPISNISGGEGFLVSLSLALGISAMASRKVRIDSMFLDEGFGTLDSQKLQETIEVLRNMQYEDGKNLGIITHVGAIQEELRLAHIDVTKIGRGRSVLSGSGVSHI